MTLAAAIVLSAISVAYSFTFLQFATSNRALLPQGKRYIERYVEFDREFGQLDDLVLAVQAPSLPEATIYANRLVRELRANRVPLAHINYRIDPKQFEGRALLYLSSDRLKEIRERVFDYQQFMEKFADRPTLDQLVDGIATSIAQAFVTGLLDLGLDSSPGASKGSLDLRFVHDVVTQIAGRLDRPTPYRSPWGGLFSVGGEGSESAGYFLSDDQRLLFILAEPTSDRGSFTGDREAIEGVRTTVATLRAEFPDVEVGVTGKPALSSDEMTAAFRDSERATLVAFGLTLALLLAAFLRVGKPLLMLLALALSLCWSMGVATLVVGHLSLFSVMFIPIVIGIGIDYGIYYLFRYEEELFLGRNLREAIEITAMRSGPGMLLSAITAAATFYVLILTDFRGLQELGFIAGSALLLSWVAMMFVFPAMLMLVDRRHLDRVGVTIPPAIRALGSVSEVDSALLLIPDDQPEKQKIIRDFAPIVAPVRVTRPQSVDIDRLLTALETLKRRFDIAAGEAPPGDTQRRLASLRDDIAQLVVRLRQTDRTVSEPALAFLQRQVYRDFVTSFQRLQANLNPRAVGLADVPPEIRRKFISDRGSFLLQIHPGVDIWDRDGATRFVNDLRTVDADVTGTPVITYEAIRLMERAYKQGTVYAIVLVSVLTFLMLRRLRETVLALAPLALGMTWTAGLMWLFDVKLNLGNVFGIPLILGAAAEFGLNIVMRFMEGRDHGGPLVARSTIMAVVLDRRTPLGGLRRPLPAAPRR